MKLLTIFGSSFLAVSTFAQPMGLGGGTINPNAVGGGGGSSSVTTSNIVAAGGALSQSIANALTMAGMSNINYSTILFVSTNGDDSTGIRGDITHPFRTIGYWNNDIAFASGASTIARVYWTPSGALKFVQSGDTVVLSGGSFTNYGISAWLAGTNANGTPVNGFNVIGQGVDITYLYPQRTPENDMPAQCVFGGFLQLGNNSKIGNFTVVPDCDPNRLLTLSTNNTVTSQPQNIFQCFGPDPQGTTGGSPQVDARSEAPISPAIGGDLMFTNSDWNGYTNAFLFNIKFPQGPFSAGSDIWFPMPSGGNQGIVPSSRSLTMANVTMYSHWDCINVVPPDSSFGWNCIFTNCLFQADYNSNLSLAIAPFPLHPAVVCFGTNIFRSCTLNVGTPAYATGSAGQNWNAGLGFNAYNHALVNTNIVYELHNCNFNINGHTLTNSYFVYYPIFTNISSSVIDNANGFGVPVGAGNWLKTTNITFGAYSKTNLF